MMKRLITVLFLISGLLMAACDKPGNGTSPEPAPKTPLEEILNKYGVAILQNGSDKTIAGAIDYEKATVTLTPQSDNWISNVAEAKATFELSGPDYSLYVGDTEQESGITANDFRKDVLYTVKDESGEAVCTFTASLLSAQSTGLPVVKIETEGGVGIYDKENYVASKVSLYDPGQPDYDITDAPAGVRGRGNHTWSLPKKPYRIKFDSKTSLFGLGAEKSWVLLANQIDPTYIMNTVAFELGHRLGVPYTNHPHHVELFLNGRHNGTYVLTEQVQVGGNRVNISKETGYLAELDLYYDEDIKFLTNAIYMPVNVKSPDPEDVSDFTFVEESVNVLIDAMFGGEGNTPKPEYRDHIDVPSVINFLLVNEIVTNWELNHPKSTYMHRDTEGKIFMGPLWDFDWGYSKAENYYFTEADILCFYNQNPPMPSYTTTPVSGSGTVFFSQFFKDPQFRAEYKARWNEMKPTIEGIGDYVMQLQEQLAVSARKDAAMWTKYGDFITETDKMKTWLEDRIEFLDAKVNSTF